MNWSVGLFFLLMIKANMSVAERVLKTCEASDEEDREALFSIETAAEFYLFPASVELPERDLPARRKILLAAWVDANALDESTYFIHPRVKLSDSLGNLIGETISHQSIYDRRVDENRIKIWLIGYLKYACIEKSTIAERWLEKALSIPEQAIYRDTLLFFLHNFNPVVNRSVKDFEEWRLEEQLPQGLRLQLIFYKNILQRGVFSRPIRIVTRESKVHEQGRDILYFQHLDDKTKDRLNKAFPLNTL